METTIILKLWPKILKPCNDLFQHYEDAHFSWNTKKKRLKGHLNDLIKIFDLCTTLVINQTLLIQILYFKMF